MVTLEVCVDDAAGLRIAQRSEVARIELCSALSVGGLTPSVGLMRLASKSVTPIYVMIRPRSGDFVFSLDEEAQMLADIETARELGLAGVVLGACREDHTLDVPLLRRLSAACGTMGRTLHRVFDLVPNPRQALEEAVSLGFERILSSGQQTKATEGAALLRDLQCWAAGRVEIMAGSGVTPQNVGALVRGSGVCAVHASCRGVKRPYPESVKHLGFGEAYAPTDAQVIGAMAEALWDAMRPG
ncbi:copper homeostasis protein CutC (plasmid) [Kozakia baliensis]|uniref:copper homeostasis protein CutC n=1 Tax=Kozakia baliensis TaxID=153496 RepID=UPI00345B7344